MECATNFRANRDLPHAFLDCFEALGIDLRRDLLCSNKRNYVGDAYQGAWLTEKQRFIEFEIYLDINDKYVTAIDTWSDVTKQVDISSNNRGTGKSEDWLALEVLNELNR